MKITIRDVAKAAGVSVATTSMALNDKKGVNAGTRDKVLRVARELSYVPDYSARSLVMRESNCIGLTIPEIQNPFYSAIVDIMTRKAEQKGYTLLLGISNNQPRQEESYIRLFLSRRVNGIIVVPMLVDQPDTSHWERVREADVPMVFCTESYAGFDEPLVMCDFEKGQYDMTRYLIGKGLRDFCFVSTSMETQFALLRQAGFERALREAGIAGDPAKIFLPKYPRYRVAYELTDSIIEKKPEAVLCINDIMTIAILKRMMERGIRVPEDISVAGFDDTMFSELVMKPLTTVRQPLEEICEKTFGILEKKISAGNQQRLVGQGARCLIEPELVIRSTTV